MTIFKKNRKAPKATTRIVTRIEKVQDTTPQQAIVSTVLHTPRWDTKREEFHGFDSPPGRF
jgi:hypothetical protein